MATLSQLKWLRRSSTQLNIADALDNDGKRRRPRACASKDTPWDIATSGGRGVVWTGFDISFRLRATPEY
jgi:hypothetical protein